MDFFDNKALIEFAKSSLGVEFIEIDGGHVASVPSKDGGRTLVSLEGFNAELRGAPKRRKGVARVSTLESFIALVNRHKDESSVIFGDFSNGGALEAVIDYHETGGSPRFGGHRVRYGFPVSPEWLAWSGQNGKTMGQGEWGSFVEDHIADLAAPSGEETAEYEHLFQTTIATPAELIQLSRGMFMTVEARVKDVRVLQSGETEISYEEVHKDGSGERLRVPGLFVVRVPLFVGGEAERVIARLRYRKVDAKLVWVFHLYRADAAMRDAMGAALDRASKETELPSYEGRQEE